MSVLLALWIVGVMPISARPRAKRVVMIALDGISVPGFTTAHTPNLDNLLAQGALSINDSCSNAFRDFAQLDQSSDRQWSRAAWSG